MPKDFELGVCGSSPTYNRSDPYGINHGEGRVEWGCGVCRMEPQIVATSEEASRKIKEHIASAAHYDAVTKTFQEAIARSTKYLNEHLSKPRPK